MQSRGSARNRGLSLNLKDDLNKAFVGRKISRSLTQDDAVVLPTGSGFHGRRLERSKTSVNDVREIGVVSDPFSLSIVLTLFAVVAVVAVLAMTC